MWRSCLRNKRESCRLPRPHPPCYPPPAARPARTAAGRPGLNTADRPDRNTAYRPGLNTAYRPGRLPLTAQPVRPYTTNGCPRATAYDLTNPYLGTASSLTSSSHPLLTSTSHLLFLSLSLPRCTFSLFLTLLCILSLHPRLSSISRLTLPSSSFIRPLSPSSLCHSSLLLHLAPLIISSSIIPSSSFSLSSSVLHPLHARSPVLCCVSRVRHAPRPKGFTNRRRVTTLPLPALLRRAPAVRRTRAWPCG